MLGIGIVECNSASTVHVRYLSLPVRPEGAKMLQDAVTDQ